jgi:pilus assembly protein Flp/PilA
MQQVFAGVGRLVQGEDGQDLIEYGLVAALIAVVVIAGVRLFGETVRGVFWDAIASRF